jgi:PAS domain S-box-containing protein
LEVNQPASGCPEETSPDWDQRAIALLSEANFMLASTLDYQETLSNIAHLAVTDFAEWCAVDVITETGDVDKVVIAHKDPAYVQWAKEFAARYPTDLSTNKGLAAVIATGESLLFSDITDEMIESASRGPEHLAEIRRIGIGSVILAALKAGGRTLGVLTLVHSQRGWFGERDLQLAKDLGRRAALALDNARLYTVAQNELRERRRVEEALRESEHRFRELADAMPVMVWISRSSEGVGFTNRYYHDYSGLGIEGRGEGGWSEVVHPDDRPVAHASYLKAIEEGTVWEQELRLRRHDGVYRWHLSRSVPIFGEDGNVLRWYGTSTDIHEQKLLSLELEERVQLRTKDLARALSEAESFNYSISHDLRAPLRAIVTTSKILLDEVADAIPAEHQRLLERQAANALRLSKLIDALLTLSRLSRAQVVSETVDLSELTKEVAVSLTSDEQGRGVEIQPDMKVTGDPSLIRTLMTVLVENALKFSSADKSVQVGQNGSVVFVKDAGVGFDTRYSDKIFQPFERLVVDEAVPGTGIGLAMADRIVSRHGGRIWAESTPGDGSTFFFDLTRS